MKQRFLLQISLHAQHVSGTTMPIIRSSRVLYGGCCLWYFVLWFSSCWSGVELMVMCPVCRMLQHPANQQLENHSTKYHRQQPLYNTLELLMMGIVVPETCSASNKICNKTSVASSWHFISTYVKYKLTRTYTIVCSPYVVTIGELVSMYFKFNQIK